MYHKEISFLYYIIKSSKVVWRLASPICREITRSNVIDTIDCCKKWSPRYPRVGWNPTTLCLASLRADINSCSFHPAPPLELTGSFCPLFPPHTRAGISDSSGEPLAQLCFPGPGGNQPGELMQPLRWSWAASRSHLGWPRVHWKGRLVTREKVLWKSVFLHSSECCLLQRPVLLLALLYYHLSPAQSFFSWAWVRTERNQKGDCHAAGKD